MTLYHWSSKTLKGWSDGDIIVVADSIEQAREYAMEKFKEEYDYLIQMDTTWDDDEAEYKYYNKFVADLHEDPIMIYNGPVAILIAGGS